MHNPTKSDLDTPFYAISFSYTASTTTALQHPHIIIEIYTFKVRLVFLLRKGLVVFNEMHIQSLIVIIYYRSPLHYKFHIVINPSTA